MSRRERQRRRRRNRGHPARRVILMTFLLLLCGVGIAALAVVGWVVNVADSAPNINQLKARTPGQVSEVFASGGQPLGYIDSDVLRAIVPTDQLPQTLKQATVAIEDRRFYQHGGVDYQGIVRAGIRDIFHPGQGVQGGSTLTMQLISNVYLPQDRLHHTIKYKIIQAKLANELESRHPKSWILAQYLNDVEYGTVGGQQAIGVGAASHMFFDKPVQDLDLAQYALLAGLPQAPSEYNPFLAPGLARARRHQVLAAMVTSRYITQAQADAADAAPLQVKRNDTYTNINQPFIFNYVRQQLIARFGLTRVEQGGLKIYTTIDPARQAEATAALLAHEPGGSGEPAAALASVNPNNGDIQALATNARYGTGPGETTFNYAWQSGRQTGSAFKVFALMTLIHDYDGDPNTTYYTSKLLAPGWLQGYPTYTVHTAEDSYQGVINITRATWLSDNTVFAQLGQDLTMPKVSQIAHEMGITSKLDNYPSEVLGAVSVSPLQMADAYATIANGGIHYPPTAVSKVVFPNGRVVDLGAPKGTRVFSYPETYAADTVLKTVLTTPGATGTAAYYGCPAAGKTGTTSNFTDAYFDGFTPQLATAVWVGYPNSTISLADGYGGTLSAPIWHDYMARASNGFCGDWTAPTNPWHGKPFFGHFSASKSRGYYTITGTTTNYQSATSTTGTGTTPGGTASTPTSATTTPQAPTPTTPKTPAPNAPTTGGASGTPGAGAGAPPTGKKH
jgi:penicillin-binding protein 1A